MTHPANADREELRMFDSFLRAQESKSAKVKALGEFVASIGCDFRFLRWPYRRQMREPAAHVEWRRTASSVMRFSRAFAAGVISPDEQPFFEKLQSQALERARAAWTRWTKKKKQIEMNYLRGRRKRLPWLC
jgi:hypothetical protein